MKNNLIEIGCEKLGVILSDEQYTKIDNYISLLVKWNKVYNLTSIKDLDDIIIRHILDSLSIIKYIPNVEKNIIDIGSGAGLPGIIIAIVNNKCRVTLLDSNSKKTTFLEQARIKLNLKNLTVVNQRAESFVPNGKFDTIIARAFADLTKFINLTEHLLSKSGIILAMKGKLDNSEVTDFNSNCERFKIIKAHKISVPFLNEERHLLEINKNQ